MSQELFLSDPEKRKVRCVNGIEVQRDIPAFQTCKRLTRVQVFDSGNIPRRRGSMLVGLSRNVNGGMVANLVVLLQATPVRVKLLQAVLPHFVDPVVVQFLIPGSEAKFSLGFKRTIPLHIGSLSVLPSDSALDSDPRPYTT